MKSNLQTSAKNSGTAGVSAALSNLSPRIKGDGLTSGIMHSALRALNHDLSDLTVPLIQTKLNIGRPDDKYEHKEMLQTKLQNAPITSQIQHLRSGGKHLSGSDRSFYESRFGHDFRKVKVHNSPKDARCAKTLGARAFTVGRDVFFGAGQFRSNTDSGRRLLAHELAHVVQQHKRPELIMRKSCDHDGRSTKCGAVQGLVDLSTTKGAEEITKRFGIDNIIIHSGLRVHFGGTWASQVQSPPNPVKGGEKFGLIDGVKVSDTGALKVEVVEIKPRSDLGGGCNKAEKEAKGYAAELNKIAPKVVMLSHGLAIQGGMRIIGRNTPNKAQKQKLTKAGFKDEDIGWHYAWNFYNSLQNRLNKEYRTPFKVMQARVNADGDSAKSYDAGLPWTIACRNKRPGKRQLHFMVNNVGGVSYGCEDECGRRRRSRKEERVRVPKEERFPQFEFRSPPLAPDEFEQEEPLPVPETGIPVVEIVVGTGAALGTLAALHKALKNRKLQKAQREALEKATQKIIREIKLKDPKLASRLNSHRLRNIGTRAYDDVLKEGFEHIDDVAKRMPRQLISRLGRKGAQALLRGGARAFFVIGIVLTAKDALAMIDQINKGAEIKIGFSLDEQKLEGQSKLELKGAEPEGKLSGDIGLQDTHISIDIKGKPDVLSGTAEIKTENVTVRTKGAVADGDPVIVDFNLKLKDTTITIRHQGQVKGAQVITNVSEISDSVIEIDLPKGALPSSPSGGKIALAGQKIKITEKQLGKGRTGKPGSKTAAISGKGTGEPAEPSKDRKTLLSEINADPKLKEVYEKIVGGKGVPVSDAFLREYAELKALFHRHPNVVSKIINQLKKVGKITDPIKQIIDPIRKQLLAEEMKIQEAFDKATKKTKGKDVSTTSPAEVASALTTPVKISFMRVKEQFIWPYLKGTKSPPKHFTAIAQWHIKTAGKALSYRFNVRAKLHRVRKPIRKSMKWMADYIVFIPTEVILSAQKDRPLTFSDAGKHYIATFFTE